tara:strand:- start:145 stop:339 length:195 start_codon:yes stop_codon:yes gene_type:complete
MEILEGGTKQKPKVLHLDSMEAGAKFCIEWRFAPTASPTPLFLRLRWLATIQKALNFLLSNQRK